MMTNQSKMLPTLGDLNYTAQKFLETDSKMSDVLLVQDKNHRQIILKIARVDQCSRSEINRKAIQNAEMWLKLFRKTHGIITIQPIAQKIHSPFQTWFAYPIYQGTLTQRPNKPNFLALEYLPGGTLKEFVGNHRLDIILALQIAHHVATTLVTLHHHDCIHRDIKPENILFRIPPEGKWQPGQTEPILIDFGVAARKGESRLVSGSRLWMAPELQGVHDTEPLTVDPSWDIYALGLILCYMITGRRPRRKSYEYHHHIEFRESTLAILNKEVRQGREPLQKIEPGLKKLIEYTLDKDPANRPTAQEFAAESARLLAMRVATYRSVPKVSSTFGEKEDTAFLGAKVNTRKRANWLVPGLWIILVLCLMVLFISPSWQEISEIGNGLTSVLQESIYGVATAEGFLSKSSDSDSVTKPILPVPSQGSRLSSPSQSVQVLMTAQPIPTATLPSPAAVHSLTVAKPIPTLASIAFAVIGAESEPTSITKPIESLIESDTPTVGEIELLWPAPETISSQQQVEFAWKVGESSVASDLCFELLFWEPDRANTTPFSVSISHTERREVDLLALSEAPDVPLNTLMQSGKAFNWGVRIVSCDNPQIIWQDIKEVRTYAYQ